MSAHTCNASSSVFGSVPKSSQPMPRAPMAPEPATKVAEPLHQAHAGRGMLGRLYQAIRQWRLTARMRNQAADMDPRIMRDVGVPDWLVNETTVRQELSRMRDADYMRW